MFEIRIMAIAEVKTAPSEAAENRKGQKGCGGGGVFQQEGRLPGQATR